MVALELTCLAFAGAAVPGCGIEDRLPPLPDAETGDATGDGSLDAPGESDATSPLDATNQPDAVGPDADSGTDAETGSDSGPRCGDKITQPPEECDDGNQSNSDACLNTCKKAKCGDSYLWSGVEQCDDGNTVTGDGCSSKCTQITNLVVGVYDACVLISDGTMKCWGANAHGELGIGTNASRGFAPDQMGDNLPVVNVGTGRTVKALSLGLEHSCAVLDNDKVKCWGANGTGELGQGDQRSRGLAPTDMGDNLPYVDLGGDGTATNIAAGNDYSCAILTDSRLKCWGANDQGALGLNDTNTRGNAPNEMGENLAAVALGTGRHALQVALSIADGSSTTCAALDNGDVKCWGYNGYGQLGLGDVQIRGDGLDATAAPTNEMGDNLPKVDLGANRLGRQLALGFDQSCATMDDGNMKCWGGNIVGELGVGLPAAGATLRLGDMPNEMGNNLPAVDLYFDQPIGITAGERFTCALMKSHDVKCWGSNSAGKLGLGDVTNRGNSATDMGIHLPYVKLGTGRTALAVGAGRSFACALLDDRTVKCWGAAPGYGDSKNRGDSAATIGDNLPPLLLP